MRHTLTIIIPALMGMILYSPFVAHAEETGVPSYQQQRQQFMDQQKKSGKASPFSEQDRQVMKQSAENLAKTLPNPGLKVGTKAPNFTLKNAFGKNVTLSKQLRNGPVVLVFYRGAWCPFCNMHLHTLNKNLPAFKKYGAQLITVTPQKPDKSAAQIKKDQYPFEVLSDLDSKVMKAYNLYYTLDPELVAVYKKHGLDVEAFNGKGRAVLPVPGTFIIDKKGVVRGVHADVDYKERMEPDAIITILKQL